MSRPSSSVRRARPLLGTLVEIRLPREALSAIEDSFEAIERVHRLMSRQDSESDVSRINAAAAGSVIAIDPWTMAVLQRAKEIHALTDGLFHWEQLEMLESAVHVKQRVHLTLDGIAKGYAVDRAVDALRYAGADCGVVNAGGDLRVFGKHPEPIYVRHPCSPGKLVHIGKVTEAAVATSGAYFSAAKFFDPRTRKVVKPSYGVTVIALDCTTADALTKPCLLEPNRSNVIADRFGALVVVLQ
jgi:thiamine biosynthesis lipoprotein